MKNSISLPARLGRTYVLHALVLCGGLASALPQQGPASALASGVLLDPTTVSNNGNRVHLNPPLSSTPAAPAVVWPRPLDAPDYALEAMFEGLLSSSLISATQIELDAISSGNAVIPNSLDGVIVSEEGIVQPRDPNLPGNSAERWMEVVFSYAGDTTGPLPNMLLSRPDPQSDLIGYFLANSDQIQPALIGSVVREQGSGSTGFPQGADIAGLDFGMAVQQFGGGGVPVELFDNENQIFFSLSPGSTNTINLITGGNFTVAGQPAHAADVYLIEWDGTDWNLPIRFASSADLGLILPTDDIDALSVDPISNNMIFSTNVVEQRNQLLYATDTGGGNGPRFEVTPLGDGAGGVASDRPGNADDTTDIDAACVIEPPENVVASHYGTAYEVPGIAGGPMSLSVTRGSTTGIAGEDNLLMEASQFTDGMVFVVFSLQFTNSPTVLNPNNWAQFPQFVILNPGQTICDLSFPIPPTASGSLITGIQATGIAINGSILAQSWPTISVF